MWNKEKVREWIGQIGYVRLFLLGLCGVFLVLVSLPGKETESSQGERLQIEVEQGENDVYVEKMEQRLEEMLGKMEGVGKAEVMITLSSSAEKIVNKDLVQEESQEQSKGEDESSKRSSRMEEETIFSDSGGDGAPYVIKEVEPSVQGILAVIEGGDNPVVVKDVTEAIEALFHVEAHKIKVLKMEDES